MNTPRLESTPANPPAAPASRPDLPETTAGSFHLEIDADRLAWLTFDTPGAGINVWNETSLNEFRTALATVRTSAARALLLRSAKPQVFIAGADLKALRHAPARQLEPLLSLGQEAFDQLAGLPLPKIALIHGACLGGGLEAALACDLRLASDSESTRLGLPETQLGLVPAWGGSTRLPRRIGLAAALELIVSGRTLAPAAALKLGLVDEVVPAGQLEAAARRHLAADLPKPALPWRRRVWHLPGLRHLLAHRARAQVLARTRGLLQAPLRAVALAAGNLARSWPKAMAAERQTLLELVRTPETGRLIDLFFQREAAAKKPHDRGVALPVHEVAVIGAGVMGSGIAQWAAVRGLRVLLQDVSPEALARGQQRVQALLAEGVRRRALTRQESRSALDRLTPEHQPVPLGHCPLVIEAASEDMALKKRLFAGLAARCGHDTLLATNTSALSVTELAETLPHPERVIGLHFFNPVHRMPLVEVITTRHTSEDAVATAVALVQHLGKTPIVVADSPGFVVNRILMPYLMEAVRLYESGVPAVWIDEAMLEFGMPMGPLRLLDEIGLDVAVHVSRTLQTAFPERLAASKTLENWVQEGRLGRKSGRGFHDYDRLAASGRRRSDAALLESIQQRLVLLLSNEAARCAAEHLVRQPSDIDLAMVLGTGYPAFRGGPLAWLQDYGVENVRLELRQLAALTPAPNAFEPAA